MTLKLVIDRFEENIAVCLDMNDKRYHIPRDILTGMEVNDIFTIELDDGIFHTPVFLAEETEATKAAVHQKMNRLFKKHSEKEE